ncbi:hypothetical protein SS50377_24325 [Spironucleus salmonicida]|uniref:Transmembrane protein n=1 Tax=Spironucleus salmonicida TaxID=348837 RepID=V6LPF4_9EUKA|nr:hypothetical protein SS50377_24325 [Spironucleus salmonicida]|eukprot:EST46123.1 Hypothetical protein SS50377_14117 [Spironucleus salmonicida]
MLIILSFSCQAGSARVEVNKQTDSIQFFTEPNPNLNHAEVTSCIAQTGQTAIYQIQIGSNTFRSQFIVYDAFKNNTIMLTPLDGSSAASASSFVIASYIITFLDNNLDQSSAVGQLIVVIYNYNQCIFDPAIQYESFKSISAIIKTNPNCIITPTADVMYILDLHENVIIQKNITAAVFDFAKFTIASANCEAGSTEFKKLCSDLSLEISGENFISLILNIIIPKTITSKNKYNNQYGVEVEEEVIYNFTLIYRIPISRRDVTVTCTKSDALAFLGDVIFIHQVPTETLCNFDTYDTQNFWISASELADETGKTFQLQFYTQDAFKIKSYIGCETWEISEFESFEECKEQLALVLTYPSNMSQSIIYKLYISNVYSGSYRFNTQNIPGGNGQATILDNQLCIKINKTILSSRTFANIELNISHSIADFNDEDIQFNTKYNFIFPSPDNNYCFTITDQQEQTLNALSFQNNFGVVSVLGNLLILTQLNPEIPYQQFWQGWVLLVAAFIFGCLLIILSSLYRKKMYAKGQYIRDR